MFEYLMPLLLTRRYRETLLDQTCRMSVVSQMSDGAERRVPWGISESGYNLVDRADNYQYKAFGVPALGLKRGLRDDLVVSPYATALAAMVDPREAARQPSRPGAAWRHRHLRLLHEAIDCTHERPDVPQDEDGGTLVRGFWAHHQGMILIALTNVLKDDVMVKRFHADPRVQATELLLQERVPRRAIVSFPRPVEETRLPVSEPALAVRRFRTPDTRFPHAQFLSNGTYTTVVTNARAAARASGRTAS